MADFSFLRKPEFWVTQIISLVLAFYAGASYVNYENSIINSPNSAFSVDQKGGITAGTIGNVNIGTDSQNRHINAGYMAEINKYLPSNKSKTIIINSVTGDSEALNFASELKKYLESQNWKVEGGGQFTRSPPIIGVGVEIRGDGSVEFNVGYKPS